MGSTFTRRFTSSSTHPRSTTSTALTAVLVFLYLSRYYLGSKEVVRVGNVAEEDVQALLDGPSPLDVYTPGARRTVSEREWHRRKARRKMQRASRRGNR